MTKSYYPSSLVQNFSKLLLRPYLSAINQGTIEVISPEGDHETFGYGESKATLKILNNRFYTKVVRGGEIGFGESYVDHDWESDNLTELLSILGKSRLHQKNSLWAFPKQIKENFVHFLNKNTKKQSVKNIHDHYDLSNELFFQFLDEKKMYSSALFKSPEESLEQAQLNKIHALIQKTAIQPTDHVLEIGCGWGGFACEAVEKTGCTLTGITISENQLEYIDNLEKEKGLKDKITFKLEDYRDTRGSFDKIISIEMIEAVGYEFLPLFFKKCNDLLVSEGLFGLQAIIYPDELYDKFKSEANWIQQYIFPGSHIISFGILEKIVASETNFKIISVEKFGKSYAKTLAEWRRRFMQNEKKIRALGFDDAFIRKWIFYFSYCEAGFDTGLLNVHQIILKKQ